MRKTFITLMALAMGFAILAIAPAQAAPEKQNHGQCVSSSPKPEGKGGRSAVATDKAACQEQDARLVCSETGNVETNSVADTVTVSGWDNPSDAEGQYDGSSLECSTNIAVIAGDTVQFTYELGTGTAPCGGGVPRIFVVIDGSYYNTIDGDPECSQANANTVTYTLPVAGTVTSVGLVYDRDIDGSVTYSNVVVGGQTLNF